MSWCAWDGPTAEDDSAPSTVRVCCTRDCRETAGAARGGYPVTQTKWWLGRRGQELGLGCS